MRETGRVPITILVCRHARLVTVSLWGVVGRFAPAGFGNPAAKPLDLAIRREQSRICRS
jgi:hypothetical protein